MTTEPPQPGGPVPRRRAPGISETGPQPSAVFQLLSTEGLALDHPGWADRIQPFIEHVLDLSREHPIVQVEWRDPLLGAPVMRDVRRRMQGELAVALRAAGIERSGANALAVAGVFLAIIGSGVELALSCDGAVAQQQILLEVQWAATEYLGTHLGH